MNDMVSMPALSSVIAIRNSFGFMNGLQRLCRADDTHRSCGGAQL
jgi:hypothetical protein